MRVISFGLLTHSCNTCAIIDCRLDGISSFMSLNRNNINLWGVFSAQPLCPLEDGEVPDKKKDKKTMTFKEEAWGKKKKKKFQSDYRGGKAARDTNSPKTLALTLCSSSPSTRKLMMLARR